MSTLCRVCGHRALLPRSVQISLRYDRTDTPRYQGGFAEVWKTEYKGRDVAVKVLKVYMRSDLVKITRVGPSLSKGICRPADVDHVEVLQGGCYMEVPSPPERLTVIGSYDDRQPADDGIRMDGQWEC